MAGSFTENVQLLENLPGGDGIISNVVPCPDSNTAWINRSRLSDITLICDTGKPKQKIAILDINEWVIHQMTLLSKNELLVTCPSFKKVLKLTLSPEQSDFNDFSTFTSFELSEPRGITTHYILNHTKRVIVGTVKGHMNELKSFDNNGAPSLSMIFDYGSPERLATNQHTSDIAVISEKSDIAQNSEKDDSERCVLVLSMGMQTKFIYTKQNSNFLPTDVAFDIWNQLLICDAMSNSILLVNEEGVLCKEIFLKCDAKLSAVACFPSGLAWIGMDGHIAVIRYWHGVQECKYEQT